MHPMYTRGFGRCLTRVSPSVAARKFRIRVHVTEGNHAINQIVEPTGNFET